MIVPRCLDGWQDMILRHQPPCDIGWFLVANDIWASRRCRSGSEAAMFSTIDRSFSDSSQSSLDVALCQRVTQPGHR